MGDVISHQEAKRLADEHLRSEGSPWVASHATRNRRYGVWEGGHRDPAHPDEMLIGGALVVTDDGNVHDVGSAPGSLDDLMMALDLWPGAEPSDVWAREGEGLALLADEDLAEAVDLAAWAEARRRERGNV